MTESANSEGDASGVGDAAADAADAVADANDDGPTSSAADPVLIYDGDCPYCSIAAVALQRIESIGAVGWAADPVGPFLDAQFDARPFAMLLVDPAEGRVYAGRSAAEELAERAGTPGIVGSLVRDNYDVIAETVGMLSGRERDPADVQDTYELTEAARERLPALRAAATEGPADVVDASDAANADA
ncbi:DUF393 domain-containing protein [Haloparvum sp. AD34]